jgi:phthiodiolone/phenolphthiodiolone dimycocerosates ketoreductase
MFMPPAELNAQARQSYEERGLDFVAWWDQMCMTFPRSIWTPDIVPAASVYDIDCYLDSYALLVQAAMVTEKIKLGIVATDCLRRAPNVLAQSFLTIDYIAKGRAFFTLGAGEVKQFAPYSLPRVKPFAHMEETIKIIRMLWETEGTVTYDGPIWQLKNAILAFQPYGNRMPPLLVAGGPGRGIEIAGKHADGWITFLPPSGSAEWYAEQVRVVKRHAEEAGRDPMS